MASYIMRRYGHIGLREIGERVGLHFSAVGNAVQRVADNPTRTIAQALRALECQFKNRESRPPNQRVGTTYCLALIATDDHVIERAGK